MSDDVVCEFVVASFFSTVLSLLAVTGFTASTGVLEATFKFLMDVSICLRTANCSVATSFFFFFFIFFSSSESVSEESDELVVESESLCYGVVSASLARAEQAYI